MEGFQKLITKANEIGIIKEGITQSDIPEDFIEFNNLIGLPRHPISFQPHPITNIQKTFIQTYCHPTRQV